MSSINALDNYTSYYNLPEKGAASTGIVFAIWQIGQMVGSLFTWIADWRGRKFMIFFGAVGVLVGTIITATAPTLGAFIGGRFILSFFATLAHLGAIMFLIEIAPTKYRGTVAGLYNTFYYFVSSPGRDHTPANLCRGPSLRLHQSTAHICISQTKATWTGD